MDDQQIHRCGLHTGSSDHRHPWQAVSFAAAAKSQGPKEVVAHAHRKQTSGRADPQLANRNLSEKLKG
jgi:hypothetical protein